MDPVSITSAVSTRSGQAHLGVISNTALTNFSLPVLTALGYELYVTGNPVLPQCLVIAFKDNLLAHGFSRSVDHHWQRHHPRDLP